MDSQQIRCLSRVHRTVDFALGKLLWLASSDLDKSKWNTKMYMIAFKNRLLRVIPLFLSCDEEMRISSGIYRVTEALDL